MQTFPESEQSETNDRTPFTFSHFCTYISYNLYIYIYYTTRSTSKVFTLIDDRKTPPRKLQVMTTMSINYVFALVDDLKNINSASCTESQDHFGH